MYVKQRIMDIDELIKLTPEQEQLCKEMESLYERMQEAGIAFAQNENGYVVVYNAQDIEDCEGSDVFAGDHPGFEYADQNSMRELFPLWCAEDLWVKRKLVENKC